VPEAPVENAPPIRRLDDLLVNQIAAGEVIERPASVLKELVENALDAGAARIVVELERGGIELVRVTDDGAGIAPGQLALAIEPHATSKLTRADDLTRIATMGFRGEALASIASVSRLSIRSRTAGDDEAHEIHAEGAALSEPRPAAGAIGTRVSVRNLFFNTPARRAFLKTPATEQGRCMDWLRDLAMARPHVGFRVACDGRVALDVPPEQGPRGRVLELLGRELDDQLVEASLDRFDDDRGVSIWGVVGLPAIARASAKAQHVFVNGRAVRDRTIQHALREAYRGLIEPGRHPTAVLMLEMSPGAVDVNVHPAKLEVRFRDQSLIHEAVRRCVKDALQRADLTPSVGGSSSDRHPGSPSDREILPRRSEREAEAAPRSGGGGAPGASGDARALADLLRTPPAAQGRLSCDALREALDSGADGSSRDADPNEPAPASAQPEPGSDAGPETPPPTPTDALLDAPPSSGVLSVHNSYLVTQDDRGVVIIDQHALHERVLFEKLLARVEAGPLESQRMLAPAVVGASPERREAFESVSPLLERLGVTVEPIGPESLGVFAFPTLLFERGVEPASFVADLLDRAAGEGFSPEREGALHEVLDMMACKAAVKAGDRLTPEEVDELLRVRSRVERSGSCPHGRPTTVRLTIEQLERLFHRR